MDRPRGFQEVEVSRFQESAHEVDKVVGPKLATLPPYHTRILPEIFPVCKSGRYFGLATLPPSCADSGNLEASTSWNPQGLSRPVKGLLCLQIVQSLGACKEGLLDSSFPCTVFYLLHMSLSHAAPRKLPPVATACNGTAESSV
jgi:hypothetical protein